MHDDDLRTYIEEIGHQRDLTRLAGEQLNAAFAAPERSLVACFAAAQAILTAAAQISKLLWADTQKDWSRERVEFAVNRAAALRKIVKPDSLLQRRAVRNSIEHYDARLDELKLSRAVSDPTNSQPKAHPADKAQLYFATVDISVSDRSTFPIPIPAENITWMRHIDPVSHEYTALDESVSLVAVVTAIGAVAARADEWLAERIVPEYQPGELGDLSDIGL